jgi:hypothetical protein
MIDKISSKVVYAVLSITQPSVAPRVARSLTDSRCCPPNGDEPMVRGRAP